VEREKWGEEGGRVRLLKWRRKGRRDSRREMRNNMRKSGPTKSTGPKPNGAPLCTAESNIARSLFRTCEHSDW
jgi:hypothetical protein